MQYTFGDMIGELFMKALALEEQRKIREEEKAYKDEAMRYQRGRDKTADERYTSERNINEQRYQDAQGYQERQETREVGRDVLNEALINMKLSDEYIPITNEEMKKYGISSDQTTTGTNIESLIKRDIYSPEKEALNYVRNTLLSTKKDDYWKNINANLERQRIYAMSNSPEKQEKRRLEKTWYKFNEFGQPDAEWEEKPGYSTDWMKKNEEQYGGIWVKGSELNTVIGKKKIEQLNYAGPTAISDVTRNSLGNQYAAKLFSLKNSPMDALLREFTPQTTHIVETPSQYNIQNPLELKKENMQKWTNKKKYNTGFFTGLLNETLNPIAKLLNEASKFRNLNKESKNELNNLEITFGGMYPDLARLWTVIEGNMIDNVMMPNGKTLKENVYDAIQESKKHYNSKQTLIQIANEQALQNAVEKKKRETTVTRMKE